MSIDANAREDQRCPSMSMLSPSIKTDALYLHERRSSTSSEKGEEPSSPSSTSGLDGTLQNACIDSFKTVRSSKFRSSMMLMSSRERASVAPTRVWARSVSSHMKTDLESSEAPEELLTCHLGLNLQDCSEQALKEIAEGISTGYIDTLEVLLNESMQEFSKLKALRRRKLVVEVHAPGMRLVLTHVSPPSPTCIPPESASHLNLGPRSFLFRHAPQHIVYDLRLEEEPNHAARQVVQNLLSLSSEEFDACFFIDESNTKTRSNNITDQDNHELPGLKATTTVIVVPLKITKPIMFPSLGLPQGAPFCVPGECGPTLWNWWDMDICPLLPEKRVRNLLTSRWTRQKTLVDDEDSDDFGDDEESSLEWVCQEVLRNQKFNARWLCPPRFQTDSMLVLVHSPQDEERSPPIILQIYLEKGAGLKLIEAQHIRDALGNSSAHAVGDVMCKSASIYEDKGCVSGDGDTELSTEESTGLCGQKAAHTEAREVLEKWSALQLRLPNFPCGPECKVGETSVCSMRDLTHAAYTHEVKVFIGILKTTGPRGFARRRSSQEVASYLAPRGRSGQEVASLLHALVGTRGPLAKLMDEPIPAVGSDDADCPAGSEILSVSFADVAKQLRKSDPLPRQLCALLPGVGASAADASWATPTEELIACLLELESIQAKIKSKKWYKADPWSARHCLTHGHLNTGHVLVGGLRQLWVVCDNSVDSCSMHALQDVASLSTCVLLEDLQLPTVVKDLPAMMRTASDFTLSSLANWLGADVDDVSRYLQKHAARRSSLQNTASFLEKCHRGGGAVVSNGARHSSFEQWRRGSGLVSSTSSDQWRREPARASVSKKIKSPGYDNEAADSTVIDSTTPDRTLTQRHTVAQTSTGVLSPSSTQGHKGGTTQPMEVKQGDQRSSRTSATTSEAAWSQPAKSKMTGKDADNLWLKHRVRQGDQREGNKSSNQRRSSLPSNTESPKLLLRRNSTPVSGKKRGDEEASSSDKQDEGLKLLGPRHQTLFFSMRTWAKQLYVEAVNLSKAFAQRLPQALAGKGLGPPPDELKSNPMRFAWELQEPVIALAADRLNMNGTVFREAASKHDKRACARRTAAMMVPMLETSLRLAQECRIPPWQRFWILSHATFLCRTLVEVLAEIGNAETAISEHASSNESHDEPQVGIQMQRVSFAKGHRLWLVNPTYEKYGGGLIVPAIVTHKTQAFLDEDEPDFMKRTFESPKPTVVYASDDGRELDWNESRPIQGLPCANLGMDFRQSCVQPNPSASAGPGVQDDGDRVKPATTRRLIYHSVRELTNRDVIVKGKVLEATGLSSPNVAVAHKVYIDRDSATEFSFKCGNTSGQGVGIMRSEVKSMYLPTQQLLQDLLQADNDWIDTNVKHTFSYASEDGSHAFFGDGKDNARKGLLKLLRQHSGHFATAAAKFGARPTLKSSRSRHSDHANGFPAEDQHEEEEEEPKSGLALPGTLYYMFYHAEVSISPTFVEGAVPEEGCAEAFFNRQTVITAPDFWVKQKRKALRQSSQDGSRRLRRVSTQEGGSDLEFGKAPAISRKTLRKPTQSSLPKNKDLSLAELMLARLKSTGLPHDEVTSVVMARIDFSYRASQSFHLLPQGTRIRLLEDPSGRAGTIGQLKRTGEYALRLDGGVDVIYFDPDPSVGNFEPAGVYRYEEGQKLVVYYGGVWADATVLQNKAGNLHMLQVSREEHTALHIDLNEVNHTPAWLPILEFQRAAQRYSCTIRASCGFVFDPVSGRSLDILKTPFTVAYLHSPEGEGDALPDLMSIVDPPTKRKLGVLEGRGVIIYGGQGIGKTTLANRLAMACVYSLGGYLPIMIRAQEMFHFLKEPDPLDALLWHQHGNAETYKLLVQAICCRRALFIVDGAHEKNKEWLPLLTFLRRLIDLGHRVAIFAESAQSDAIQQKPQKRVSLKWSILQSSVFSHKAAPAPTDHRNLDDSALPQSSAIMLGLHYPKPGPPTPLLEIELRHLTVDAQREGAAARLGDEEAWSLKDSLVDAGDFSRHPFGLTLLLGYVEAKKAKPRIQSSDFAFFAAKTQVGKHEWSLTEALQSATDMTLHRILNYPLAVGITRKPASVKDCGEVLEVVAMQLQRQGKKDMPLNELHELLRREDGDDRLVAAWQDIYNAIADGQFKFLLGISGRKSIDQTGSGARIRFVTASLREYFAARCTVRYVLEGRKTGLPSFEEMIFSGAWASFFRYMYAILQASGVPITLDFTGFDLNAHCTSMLLEFFEVRSLRSPSLRLTVHGPELSRPGRLPRLLTGVRGRLERFAIRCCALGKEGMSILSRAISEQLITPSHLDLRHCSLGHEGIQVLADVLAKDEKIIHLNLAGNIMGSGGAVHMATALQTNEVLQHLELGNNGFASLGAEALVASISSRSKLQHLGIASNRIGDDGSRHLADLMRGQWSLRVLDIGANNVNALGMQRLAPGFTESAKIEELSLSGNPIGPDGMWHFSAALQSLQGASALRRLDLEYTMLCAEGGAHLASMFGAGAALESLELRGNRLGSRGVSSLAFGLIVAQDRQTSKLRRLGLRSNACMEEGATALASVLNNEYTLLEDLDLSENRLGDGGAAAIARGLQARGAARRLQKLVLNANSVGPAGGEALGKALCISALPWLDLSGNNIGDAGALALSRAMMIPSSRLAVLNVERNRIGQEGAAALAAAVSQKKTMSKLAINGNFIGEELQPFAEDLCRVRHGKAPKMMEVNMWELDKVNDEYLQMQWDDEQKKDIRERLADLGVPRPPDEPHKRAAKFESLLDGITAVKRPASAATPRRPRPPTVAKPEEKKKNRRPSTFYNTK